MKKLKMKRSKLICMLISLVASIFLWVYVVTVVSQEKSETIYNIPITFTGVETLREQNLTIAEGADTTVNLQVTGRRTVVQSLNRDNITLTVDVSKINMEGEYNRNYTITYPDSVQVGSISTDRKTPESVNIKIERLFQLPTPVLAKILSTRDRLCLIQFRHYSTSFFMNTGQPIIAPFRPYMTQKHVLLNPFAFRRTQRNKAPPQNPL